MAKITECIYCHRNVCNSPWHDKCRGAYLEDLLAQIKTALADGQSPGTELTAQICQENFLTWDQFEKQQAVGRELASRKQLHDLAKHEDMQRAAEEFERDHPDPDPQKVTYAKAPDDLTGLMSE